MPLLTAGLLIAGVVLLVIGWFVVNSLGLIYLSMACAALAGVALIVFAKLSRRRAVRLAAQGLAGVSPPAVRDRSDPDRIAGRASAEVSNPSVPALGPLHGTDPADSGGDDDGGEKAVFPIADYDRLRVAEILPMLNRLELTELEEVRDREIAGKARKSVLTRLEDLLGRRRDPLGGGR